MDDLFRFADDLGPAKILQMYQPSLNLRAVLVVDNVAAGPSIGGTRMAPDVSVEECFRLARAMTLKNAAAGLPHGGGKSVIVADPAMPAADKERLMRAFARALADIDDYIVGPDMRALALSAITPRVCWPSTGQCWSPPPIPAAR
jgi:glutamate dehydrogenase/leucine dehydrogenase